MNSSGTTHQFLKVFMFFILGAIILKVNEGCNIIINSGNDDKRIQIIELLIDY